MAEAGGVEVLEAVVPVACPEAEVEAVEILAAVQAARGVVILGAEEVRAAASTGVGPGGQIGWMEAGAGGSMV